MHKYELSCGLVPRLDQAPLPSLSLSLSVSPTRSVITPVLIIIHMDVACIYAGCSSEQRRALSVYAVDNTNEALFVAGPRRDR